MNRPWPPGSIEAPGEGLVESKLRGGPIGAVRSRTPGAPVHEILTKRFGYNLTAAVPEMFENGGCAPTEESVGRCQGSHLGLVVYLGLLDVGCSRL